MKTILMCAVILSLSACATANYEPPPPGAARPVLMGNGAMVWWR